MNQDRLWAPWRLEYVAGGEAPSAEPLPEPVAWLDGSDRGCFLCRASARYDGSSNAMRRLLVVERGGQSLIVLNRYPYNNGHVLVAPLRHIGEFDELAADEHLQCLDQIGRLTRIFRRHMNAEGFNVGLNLGRAAGAGLPGHLHWHLVPRWSGDNNFMPVLAGTRVIPQALDALWQLLAAELATRDSGNTR